MYSTACACTDLNVLAIQVPLIYVCGCCSAKSIESLEELQDVYKHFLLYYGCDIPKMKAHMKAKEKAEKAAAGEEGGENAHADDDDDTLKQATRKSAYAMCVKAGLCE